MRSLNAKYLAGMFVALSLPLLSGCSDTSEAAKADLAAPKPGIATVVKEDVAIITAEAVELPQTVWLTGSLAADELSEVASKQTGIVGNVLIDRGSIVKQGDVLVQLDTVDAVNALERSEAQATELLVRLGLTSTEEQFEPAKQPDVKAAKAALDLATTNFERDKALMEKKVIAPGEFDETRNAYSTAVQSYDLAVAQAGQLYQQFKTTLANVKTARQAVEDMTVKAPYDGAIVEKSVSPGEAVAPGAQVATIVRISPLRLLLNVPEIDVGKIREDQPVNFKVDAFPGQQFQGTVKRISPALDAETRTLVVEALVPNEDMTLKPGLFVTAEVQIDADRQGVTVPATAVRRRNDVDQVFIVDDGIARAIMVVAGQPRQGNVEIVEGLKGGESIVQNAAEVEDGVRIQ